MREIKFRGKRLDNGEWADGFVLFSQDKSEAVIAKLTATESVCETVDPATVGQFTGLHDKNGKEIYEGDVIKSEKARHYVRYIEDQAMFVANIISKNPIVDYCSIFQTWIDKYNKVVIGNIHDNPELLKTE